jgi:hypothetical protein
MTKSKDAKDDEYYKGIIRGQSKEIKRLNQKIKQLQKLLGYSQNHDGTKTKVKEVEKDEPDCPDCARGYLKEMNLMNRQYIVCDVCSYRKKI